ncbi:MAG: hypothetical protein ACJASL_002039 [Paraglaciecola sp.]|jgi:hypothetical protein
MKEIALKIGNPSPLTAIVNTPKKLDSEKPAVLIFNSGVMHHVGSCRLSVKLARELAKSNILSLRFDFSGIGDSGSRSGTLAFHETSIAEITEVMDYLEKKRGIKRFIVYGLCSGADAAYDIALVDPRVIAMVQIDPYCYRTWKWYIRHYSPRLLSLNTWLNYFTRRFKLQSKPLGFSESVDSDNLETASYIREFPARSDVAKGLQQLVNGNIKIYSIITGSQAEIINRSTQFKESFFDVEFRDLLTVEYYPKMDHIITNPEYQRLVIDKICTWMVNIVDSKQH